MNRLRLRMVERYFLVTPDVGQAFRTEILVPQDAEFFSVGFIQDELYAWAHIPHYGMDVPATGPLARLLVLSSLVITDFPRSARAIGTAIRASDGYAVHVFDLGPET